MNEEKSSTSFTKGSIVRAVYREPEIADHAGNPLEEALPPMFTTDQLILRLQHFPAYNESDRNAPDEVRYLANQNSMRFFAPLDIHIDLYRRITNVTRIGYAGRNPMAEFQRLPKRLKLDTFDQYNGQQTTPGLMSTAAGFNIAGISGVGKSFSIDRILKLSPQAIHHSEYKKRPFTHTQIVWLKIDCPFDGNPRGLCISFFKAVDGLLGTNYRKAFVKRRQLQTELLADMATVAENHFLGVLVIDEIQRLSLARSGGADLLLNFFVQLVNEIGVPVLLVGTYKALRVLSGEFSQLRRGTGQGDLIWDRMRNDEQWASFVKSLFHSQYTRKKFSPYDPVPLSPHEVQQSNPIQKTLSDVLYEESQGITDLAVKMYMFAQERAIDTEKEIVTANIIRSVARDKFAMLRDVLVALRENNKGALAAWDDVYPAFLQKYFDSLPKNEATVTKIEGTLAEEPGIKNKLQVLEEKNEPKRPLESHTAVAPVEGVSLAPVQDRRSSGVARKVKRRTKKASKGVLPTIVASLKTRTGEAAYEALKQAGYIKSGAEFVG